MYPTHNTGKYPLITKTKSYKDLQSYKASVIICDFNSEFLKRYVNPKSRTFDQMDQAGRSGKQNLAEGSSEITSEKSELYLVGIARASFQELLEDYQDDLRKNNWPQWAKDDPRALKVRGLYRIHPINPINPINPTRPKPADQTHLSETPYWEISSERRNRRQLRYLPNPSGELLVGPANYTTAK